VDFLVSTRAHPVDIVFSRMCELTPMYVLGLASPIDFKGSLVPILATVIGTFWGFFIHANVRWRFGPLEWLVSTPAFHHWHHTNDGPAYINKNYATMLDPFVAWRKTSSPQTLDQQTKQIDGTNTAVAPPTQDSESLLLSKTDA
jgi:sterol desaturase/sphingolipid hydroxylase (fatty acid hydroxylase superfamily)